MTEVVVRRLRRWNWSEAARMVRGCVMERAGEVVVGLVKVQEERWGERLALRVLAALSLLAREERERWGSSGLPEGCWETMPCPKAPWSSSLLGSA